MKWTMWKGVHDPIVIEADSFDEAIEKAREISPDYDAGQPKKEGA